MGQPGTLPGLGFGLRQGQHASEVPDIHWSSLEGGGRGTGHESQANRKCKCLTLGF